MNRPRFALTCLLLLAAVWPATSRAEDAAKKPRVLMVTQSAGFKHGSVTRKDDKLSPAEQAITDLAASSGAFTVDCTQDVAKDLTAQSA